MRRLFARIALLCGALLLVLLVGEALTRLLLPPSREVSWYHYDDRYGFRNRSNADARTNVWGDREWWRFWTNSRGFRGAEWPLEPPQGVRRVLVLGDSFTFGNAVDEAAAFPRVADAILREVSADAPTGERWDVLNLGVSAWGPSNALAYLQTEGDVIAADCAIYAFFVGNDVVDHLIHQLYELRDGELVRVEKVQAPPSMAKRVRDAMRAFPVYNWLLERSQLANVIRRSAMGFLLPRDATHQRMTLYTDAERERFDAALALNDAVLDELAALARDRFGAFGILLIPMRTQLAPGLEGVEDHFPGWMADLGRERVLAWGGRSGVPVVDLGERLPSGPDAVRALFFEQDFHWNEHGHRLVGEALAQEIPRICSSRPTR